MTQPELTADEWSAVDAAMLIAEQRWREMGGWVAQLTALDSGRDKLFAQRLAGPATPPREDPSVSDVDAASGPWLRSAMEAAEESMDLGDIEDTWKYVSACSQISIAISLHTIAKHIGGGGYSLNYLVERIGDGISGMHQS